MSTNAPRGTTASPGTRPVRLVGALLAALMILLLVSSHGRAADAAAVADPVADPAAPAATVTVSDTTAPGTTPAADTAAPADSVGGTTSTPSEAPPATPAPGTTPGIYAPDDPTQSSEATPIGPAEGPDAAPGTVTIVDHPDLPLSNPGDAKSAAAGSTYTYKPETADPTTAGRDTGVGQMAWIAPAAPDAAPLEAARGTAAARSVVPSRPSAGGSAPFTARLADPLAYPKPLGSNRGAPESPAGAAKKITVVRTSSPIGVDGALPAAFTAPVLSGGGGPTSLFEMLAGYVLPGAANPASGVMLMLFPLAILLAALTPRLPRLHLLGIVSETGSGSPGFNPVALRPG